jgi:hypothetical protein
MIKQLTLTFFSSPHRTEVVFVFVIKRISADISEEEKKNCEIVICSGICDG